MSKQTLISGALGLIAGLLIMNVAAFNTQNETLMMEDQSRYDFETTVEKLEESVAEAGWSIINTHNMQRMIAQHGHDVDEIKIFELCSAKYSAQILEHDHERIISPLMPCRLAIYNKSNGNTYITRMDNQAIAEQHGGIIEEVMTEVTVEVEKMIDDLLVN